LLAAEVEVQVAERANTALDKSQLRGHAIDKT
jgi:hypothetical protein